MATKTSSKNENIYLMSTFVYSIIVIAVGLILFWMPLYIDIELKHVFNTAKEILFGKILMVAFVAWGGHNLLKGRLELPKAKAFYLFGLVNMLVSTIWSASANLSFRELGPQAGCFLLFFIILWP